MKVLDTKISTIEVITPDIIRGWGGGGGGGRRIFKLCPKRPSFKRDAIQISLKKRRTSKTDLENTMYLLTICFLYFID